MKGILLAGGRGTRLYPITRAVSKHLVPIYDKPMIYYPISVLMLTGLREILIISTPEDLPAYRRLLGSGESIGVRFDYVEQAQPDGLARAFHYGAEFLAGQAACMILGDNIFYGHGLGELLSAGMRNCQRNRATVFAYWVREPKGYGVVELDQGRIVSLEEKPANAKSNYAIPGLYFYPADVVELAARVQKSERGEHEITTLNQLYHDQGRLSAEVMKRGFAWLDTGTHENLLQASQFIKTIEIRQGLKVACLEEIAFNMNYIDKAQLQKLAQNWSNNQYGDYLKEILQREQER